MHCFCQCKTAWSHQENHGRPQTRPFNSLICKSKTNPQLRDTLLQIIPLYSDHLFAEWLSFEPLLYRNHQGKQKTQEQFNLTFGSLTTFENKGICITSKSSSFILWSSIFRWLPNHFNGWTFHAWAFMWPCPADVANAWCCPNHRPLRTWKFNRSKPWNKESWVEKMACYTWFYVNKSLFARKEEAFMVSFNFKWKNIINSQVEFGHLDRNKLNALKEGWNWTSSHLQGIIQFFLICHWCV